MPDAVSSRSACRGTRPARRATGSGRWMCRRWPTPSIVRSSTCGTDERRNAATSTNSGSVSVPSTDSTGQRMAAACSGPNAHSAMAGSSTPKRVSASLTACATAPGHPLLEHGPARCPVQAGRGAQEQRPRSLVVAPSHTPRTRVRPAGAPPRRWAPRASTAPAGSASARSRDGRAPAGRRPPRRWSGRRRGRAALPRCSRSAAASAACVAMLTGGGVWVLPTQPRLWYRISW